MAVGSRPRYAPGAMPATNFSTIVVGLKGVQGRPGGQNRHPHERRQPLGDVRISRASHDAGGFSGNIERNFSEENVGIRSEQRAEPVSYSSFSGGGFYIQSGGLPPHQREHGSIIGNWTPRRPDRQ